eukprot:9181947-Pyramimonas_sp.AAC.1
MTGGAGWLGAGGARAAGAGVDRRDVQLHSHLEVRGGGGEGVHGAARGRRPARGAADGCYHGCYYGGYHGGYHGGYNGRWMLGQSMDVRTVDGG